jgi:hypothetical protein
VSALTPDACAILERAALCSVAASTSAGPHVTPVVFAASGGELWVTTARGSVKARAWSRDRRAAGLVRDGARAVCFRGTVRIYDALDPRTWPASAADWPALAAAAARFTRKNARFFAGYAVDARRVPLAWTPPGRVLVRIRPLAGAVVVDGVVRERWGPWPAAATPVAAFRRAPRARDPLAGVPREVASGIGRVGAGALAWDAGGQLVVLPVRWVSTEHGLYAAAPERVAALAEPAPRAPAAVAIDAASRWRARDMVGVMVQGTGRMYPVAETASGRRSASRLVREAGHEAGPAILVRIDARRIVWWRGWSSGWIPVPGPARGVAASA